MQVSSHAAAVGERMQRICMHHMQGGAADATGLLTAALTASIYAMHRVHHVQGGADDVTGLLTAALTASIHADRPCQRGHACRPESA